MTAPVFEDAAPMEYDTVPEMDTVEYPCHVCGKEAGPYAGRGQKPKYCDIHKKNKTRATGGTSRKTSNDALANQATAVLVQLNNGIAIAAMAMGFLGTGSALSANNAAFADNAFEALKTDPELCKFICKGGGSSGKLALVMAYGALGTQVVPVAVNEFKTKRAEMRAKKEEQAEHERLVMENS